MTANSMGLGALYEKTGFVLLVDPFTREVIRKITKRVPNKSFSFLWEATLRRDFGCFDHGARPLPTSILQFLSKESNA